MTQEQILKEQNNLILAQLETTVAYNYYMEQHIQIMKELVSNQKETINMEEILELPSEEKNKKIIELKKKIARFEAGQELLKQIDRLQEKALRKDNEARKRLELFCKRHGLEQPV